LFVDLFIIVQLHPHDWCVVSRNSNNDRSCEVSNIIIRQAISPTATFISVAWSVCLSHSCT